MYKSKRYPEVYVEMEFRGPKNSIPISNSAFFFLFRNLSLRATIFMEAENQCKNRIAQPRGLKKRYAYVHAIFDPRFS